MSVLQRLRSGRSGLFGRYTASSVIAGVISQGTFMICYAVGTLPSVASIIAFIAGAVPNYFMNRYWAWQQTDRVRPARELLPYVVINILTALLASVLTTGADVWLRDRIDSHTWQVILVSVAFVGTYAVMFVLKFFLFDKLIFTRSNVERGPATRS